MISWSVADNELDREHGVRFLCEHSTDLGLLYNWSTVMNSLYYSIEDNGFLVGKDAEGEIASVLAHTIGTLEDGYEDLGRIEIHLLYIEEKWRTGAVLLSALRMFVERMYESPREVREVVFFTPSTEENRSRFGKLAVLTKTTEPPCGKLDFYTATWESLQRFDAVR